MAKELFEDAVITEQTWNSLFGMQTAPSGGSPESSVFKATNKNTIDNATINTSTLQGCSFISNSSGARVEILKSDNIGLEMYNSYGLSRFKFEVGGTNSGDLTVGSVADGNYLKWDDSTGTLTVRGDIVADVATIGGFTVDSDHIVDTADSFGLSSVVTAGDDIRFWAGETFANRASAPFYVTESGEVSASNITITGGSVAASILDGTIGLGNLDLANRGWVQTCAFSVTDADTVAWASGTFTAADGTAYNISAGNTGNMAAKTYIYLDVNVSETAYQTTTTATTAVGAGKVLVAIAENGTGEATYQVINGQGGVNIDASSIVAGSITGNEIAASTITAGKITVTSLSAISTNMGTVTVDSSGYIRGGATGYLTGTGFYLGYDTDAYKMSIGNPSGDYLSWDGTNLDFTGSLSYKVSVEYGENIAAGQAVGLYTDYFTSEQNIKSIYKEDWNAFSTYRVDSLYYRHLSIEDGGELYVVSWYQSPTSGSTKYNIEVTKQTRNIVERVALYTSDDIAITSDTTSRLNNTMAYDSVNKKIILCTAGNYQIIGFDKGNLSFGTAQSWTSVPASYTLASVVYDVNEETFVIFFYRSLDNYILHYYTVQCNSGSDLTSTASAGATVPISDTDNKLRGVFRSATINPTTGYIYFNTYSATTDYNRIFQVRVKADKTLEQIGTRYSPSKSYMYQMCYDETADCLVCSQGESTRRYAYAFLVAISGTTLTAGSSTTLLDAGSSNQISTSTSLIYNSYLGYCAIVWPGYSSTSSYATRAFPIIIDSGVIDDFEVKILHSSWSEYSGQQVIPFITKESFNVSKVNNFSGVASNAYEIIPFAYGSDTIKAANENNSVTVYKDGLNAPTVIKNEANDIFIATYKTGNSIRAIAFTKGGDTLDNNKIGTYLELNNTADNGNVRCALCGQDDRFVAVYHYKLSSETGELKVDLCEVDPSDLSISVIESRTIRADLISAQNIVAFYNHFNNTFNVGHQYHRRNGGVDTVYWEYYTMQASGDATTTLQTVENALGLSSLATGGLSLYAKQPYWVTCETVGGSVGPATVYIGGKEIDVYQDSTSSILSDLYHSIWSERYQMLITPQHINEEANTYSFVYDREDFSNTSVDVGSNTGQFEFYDENEDKIIFTSYGTATQSIGVYKIDEMSNKFICERINTCSIQKYGGSWISANYSYFTRNSDGTLDLLTQHGTTTSYIMLALSEISLNALSNYVGYTYEAGVSGESKLVDYPNSVATVSGLTTGKFYYLGNRKLLSSPTQYKAGYAKSSNKLVIIK